MTRALDPFSQMLNGLDLCWNEDLDIPTLMLLYAGIDILASLGRPADKSRATRVDFIEWVDRYLLPGSGLQCTGRDLYGARCGLLHALSAESSMSVEGESRQVWYSTTDDERFQAIVERLGQEGKVDAVAVNLDALVETFVNAVRRFGQAIEQDPDLAARVESRSRKLFANIRRTRPES